MDIKYLFRGKREDTGDWEKGSLVVEKKDSGQVNTTIINMHTGLCAQVDRRTVGQCAGTYDKKGRPIFEDDFLRVECYNADGSCAVYMGFLESGWLGNGLRMPDGHGGGEWAYLCDLLGESDTAYTILGNFYDNPELWEG